MPPLHRSRTNFRPSLRLAADSTAAASRSLIISATVDPNLPPGWDFLLSGTLRQRRPVGKWSFSSKSNPHASQALRFQPPPPRSLPRQSPLPRPFAPDRHPETLFRARPPPCDGGTPSPARGRPIGAAIPYPPPAIPRSKPGCLQGARLVTPAGVFPGYLHLAPLVAVTGECPHLGLKRAQSPSSLGGTGYTTVNFGVIADN
jgi:hypothetical protein